MEKKGVNLALFQNMPHIYKMLEELGEENIQ
jgi:hypothetical protein